MTFHWPHAFWLLFIPLVLLVRDLRRRRITPDAHPKITHATASSSSLVISHSSSQRRRSLRTRWFLYLALAAATAALARPQWGRIEEPVFDQAREIIIALDLSRSMLADDIKPTRLERARLLITSLLERLKGERVGLIVFSGTAFLQSPLSADYEILREFLPLLEPGYLPEGGTNYDALLDTTLTAFGASGSADRFLIVLSDGEAQNETWRKHLDDLKTKGIRVLGLGIGTAKGAMIPDGSGAFMKDERGAVVLSKLDSGTLQELSTTTGGRYADASAWVDLSQLIHETVEQGKRGDFTEANRVRLAERFQWPLAAAVFLFLLSFWREFPVRPKPRPIQLATNAAALLLLTTVLGRTASSHAAENDAALAAPLTELVGQLAARAEPSASDYAELARTTIDYAQRAQSTQTPVIEGVIRDALAAVDAGESINPKTADWPTLRSQLEALLPKENQPPEKQDKSDENKKPDQNKKDQSDDKNQKGESDESDENKPQEKSDQPQDQQKKNDPGEPGESKSENNQKSDGDDPSADQEPSKPDSQKKPDSPGQSAFGEMANDEPPPPPKTPEASPEPADTEPQSPSEMQQVGGAAADTTSDPARLDPSLAIPLQKLDQVKQGDSPAQLFQLLQGPPTEPAPSGKNW